MKNIIDFENGISHEFTNDEIHLLKKAIQNLKISDDEKEARALERLESLFLHHID